MDLLDQMQKLSEQHGPPEQLRVLIAQVMCGDDEDAGMIHVCEQDAKLALAVIYGWRKNASPQQPCPVCQIINGTCPYHQGVDDAIEADLAAGVRYRWTRPTLRHRLNDTWRSWRMRAALWSVMVFSLLIALAGTFGSRQDRTDALFVIIGYSVTVATMILMALHLVSAPGGKRQR